MTSRKKRSQPDTDSEGKAAPTPRYTAVDASLPVNGSITLYDFPSSTRYAYLHLQEPNALAYVPVPCTPEPVMAARAAARFAEYEAQGMPAIEAYVRLGTEFRHLGSLGPASAT